MGYFSFYTVIVSIILLSFFVLYNPIIDVYSLDVQNKTNFSLEPSAQHSTNPTTFPLTMLSLYQNPDDTSYQTQVVDEKLIESHQKITQLMFSQHSTLESAQQTTEESLDVQDNYDLITGLIPEIDIPIFLADVD